MNFYRNAHFHVKNQLKAELESTLLKQFANVGPILGQYQVRYNIYYKNPSCDGSNIAALMEKVFLDAGQLAGILREDNVQHHLGSTWSIAGQDKLNPRCEIQITQPESV
jgi:hypothetical protein